MSGGKEPLEKTDIFKLFPQSIFSVLSEVAIFITDDYFRLYLASNHKKKCYNMQNSPWTFKSDQHMA